VGTCLTPTDGTGAWYNGQTGKFNYSLKFDGTDDSVSVGNSIAGVQSVAFWVKPASPSASLMQLATGTDIKATSGTIGTDGFTSPTIYVNGVVNGTVTAGAWNHVVVTTGTGNTANSILLGKAGRAQRATRRRAVLQLQPDPKPGAASAKRQRRRQMGTSNRRTVGRPPAGNEPGHFYRNRSR
jgi:hypothetical protein